MTKTKRQMAAVSNETEGCYEEIHTNLYWHV